MPTSDEPAAMGVASDISQYTKTVMEEVVDKDDLKQEMVDKWSIKPSLAEKMVDILQFMADKEENLQQKSEPIMAVRC